MKRGPPIDVIEDVMRSGRAQRIVARGGSMEPAIQNGAEIELVPLTAPPRLGDVVVVRTEGHAASHGLLIHRVVGVRTDGAVLLRGDACADADGWIAPRDVLGRALLDGAAPPPAVPRVRRSLLRRLAARVRAWVRGH